MDGLDCLRSAKHSPLLGKKRTASTDAVMEDEAVMDQVNHVWLFVISHLVKNGCKCSSQGPITHFEDLVHQSGAI